MANMINCHRGAHQQSKRRCNKDTSFAPNGFKELRRISRMDSMTTLPVAFITATCSASAGNGESVHSLR
jgi:hypothetical protein